MNEAELIARLESLDESLRSLASSPGEFILGAMSGPLSVGIAAAVRSHLESEFDDAERRLAQLRSRQSVMSRVLSS